MKSEKSFCALALSLMALIALAIWFILPPMVSPETAEPELGTEPAPFCIDPELMPEVIVRELPETISI